MRFRPIFFVFATLLLDCAALERLPTGTCGNGVVDAAEDCDTFPNDPNDKTHARCGAASEGESACRLHCGKQSNGDVLACPDGWGCSVGGICREPTGTFGPALAPVSAGVTNLSAGDFDGDGRRDLLGTGTRNLVDNASRVRVHYFDDLGGLAQIASLPSQLVSPVAVDVDRNGRDDIAFGLAQFTGDLGALGVLSGLADRTFLPVLFPALSFADTETVPVTVRPTRDVPLPNGGFKTATLLFSRTVKGAKLTSLENEVGAAGLPLDRDLPVGPEGVHGPIVAALIHDLDDRSTCGEIIAAVDTPEGPRIVLFSPCTFTVALDGSETKTPRWATQRAFESIVVPKPLGARGVLVADVNHDKHLDLLVDTVEGPYLALGDGTTLSPLVQAPGAEVMPLAAADLDGDGIVDYVFPRHIAVSRNPGSSPDAGADAGDAGGAGVVSYTIAFQTQGNWANAIIGNFNGDTFPDVATIRAGSPDVQLYAGSQSGTFTPYTVTTDRIVQSFTKGDFDGDHVEDLAVQQASIDPIASDIAIAYGRAVGGPEPSRIVGRTDRPEGILGFSNERSAVDDIGVYAFGPRGASGLRSTSFTLLVGSGDRQPLAPLFFVDTLSLRPIAKEASAAGLARLWIPVGLVAGAFGQANAPDVLAYAVGFTVNLKTGERLPGYLSGAWSANANRMAAGGLDAPKEVQNLETLLEIVDPASFAVVLATATGDVDLAPNKLDEVVVIANVPGGKDSLIQVIRPLEEQGGNPAQGPGPGGGPRPDGGGGGLLLPGQRIAPGAQLEVVDVDGDGFRDAVCIFGVDDARQVFVFLNDKKGGFAGPGIAVPSSVRDGGTPADSAPSAFATITVGGAPVSGGNRTRALAVLSRRGVALATLRADKTGFDVKELQLGPAGIVAGTGIAAGDFNGDGVEDLGIADAGSVRLVLQTPARQRP